MRAPTLLATVLTLVWLLPTPVLAGLETLPTLPTALEAGAAPTPGKPLARVELATGEALLISGGKAWRAASGMALADGDLLQVPEGARLRVAFNNGDAMHLGVGSLLDIKDRQEGWLARIWRGAIAIYAAPHARGGGQLETHRGILEAGEGKLGMVVPEPGGPVTVYAFNNWRAWEEQDKAYQPDTARRDWQLRAIWKGVGSDIAIPAGGMLRVAETTRQMEVDPGFEVDFTYHTSPEAEALRQSIQAFDQGRLEAAKVGFAQLQQAFPKNAFAAYYLGLLALEADQTQEAIRQWQRYSQLDPSGASDKGIPERLTLLIHQHMKDEIELALKQESAMGDAKPEPGSVAVLPYINRGDASQALLAKGLAALIVTDLSKVPGLKVLERAKLQKLMDELSLSQSGIVEQQSALRAGRLMRAEKLLIGDYKVEKLK